MATKQNLSDLLQNVETPLEKKLKIALSTFTVADLSSVKNKEITLLWLKQLLLNEPRDDVYSVLKSCIVNATDVWLHPKLTDPIISMVTSSQSCRNSIECCVELLKSVHFLRYFVHNVQKMADVIVWVVNAIESVQLDDQFVTDVHESVIDCILNVKSNALYNSDLKIIFCKDLVQSMSIIVNRNDKLVNSMENCFHRVLFNDTEFRNIFTKYILNESSSCTEREQYVITIIDNIRGYPTQLSNEVLATSYGLLFAGYLLSNANYDCKFKVFVALSTFVNVHPCPADSNRVILNEQSISTVNTLVWKILKYDLPLDSTTNAFSLIDWLNAFVDSLLNSINDTVDVSTLQLLQNVLNCSPHVMENCIKKFTKMVMLIKKTDAEVISSYSSLCLDVLNVHIKLNRMHKLISALLVTINENLDVFSDSNVPDKFDVLPEEIFNKIQTAVTNLPSTVQNVALLNTLLYHLRTDCITRLRSNQSKRVDVRMILMFDIVTYLISRFISGTRIVDHSVPDIVKSKFAELMLDLALLLGKFGEAVICKEHNSKLMESFLHLCYVWGEMQIIFITYEFTRRKVPKQVGNLGNSATNFIYLHPYLSDYHWELIAQRVVNFGDENCRHLLYDLVLQKINALPNLEDEINGPYIDEGPATVCAHYLINQADEKWLFGHIAQFVHLLKPFDVFTLSKSLVKYYESNDQVCQIDEDFQEMRPLVLAMLCSAFHNIGKQFLKSNMKELKRVLRKLEFKDMLEAETESENQDQLVNSVLDAIKEIGSLLSNDFDFVDKAEDISIERSVSLLVSLPVASLRQENKSVVFYLTLSLLKNLIKLKYKTHSIESVLGDVSKLLLSVSENIIITETLSINEELVWFYRGLKNTTYCQAVLERLCKLTNVSYESVIASDDSNADRMEIGEYEGENIDLDARSFSDQLPKPTVENLSKLNRYWRLAIKEKNQKNKQRILSKACRLVQRYVISGGSNDDLISISPVTRTFLKIFIDIIQNKKFAVLYPMIDLSFELISFAANVNQQDDELLVEAIELLFGICKVRMPLVLDRIPTFYLCYKNLFIEIAKRSVQGGDKDVEALTCGAHKLEKLTDVLQKHKKDFTKTAISAVADFVGVFAEHSVDERVKMHLKNVMYCWIGISDSHVNQYLSSKLSPVSQKLFQQFWSDYNKYYKFSGKV